MSPHQNELSLGELQALHARGIRYLVVAVGDIGQLKAGNVVSRHKTNDGAQKTAGASSWYAVADIADEIAEAGYRA